MTIKLNKFDIDTTNIKAIPQLRYSVLYCY